MSTLEFFELLKLLVPEMIVVVAALAVLGVDLFFLREDQARVRWLVGGALSGFACLGAIFWMWNVEQRADVLEGMLVVNSLVRLVKGALLLLTLFTILISIDAAFTNYIGEYLALVLMATVGLMLLVSTEQILMIFIALELTSLSLYTLAAFNKQDAHSAEAALKYFLFGGMSAAFTLFGLSLIYGLSGATNLKAIATALQGRGADPLLLVAVILTVIGFGFKIAAVPFHLWAPDAYQGAPTPSAALIASGSKLASFFVLAKVMSVGFAGAEGSGAWRNFQPGWVPVLAIVAAVSILLGNLAALAQSNVKRLLAYSAIAHSGYALLAVMSGGKNGTSPLVYYVITYGLTVLGAFGVAAVVERQTGNCQMTSFAGLAKRAPALSLCMMVFMLSLAGIPPLAGFFGKFYLFVAAAAAGPKSFGLLWLVILAIAMSAVSLYYYLQVLKQIYVVEAPESAPVIPSLGFAQIAILVLALSVLALGCAPNLLLGWLVPAIQQANL